MKYKSIFTVIYSKKTGKILEEIWEPRKRLFWPLPWIKLPGNPKFKNWEELNNWFEENYKGKNLNYSMYGKELSKD